MQQLDATRFWKQADRQPVFLSPQQEKFLSPISRQLYTDWQRSLNSPKSAAGEAAETPENRLSTELYLSGLAVALMSEQEK